ncbi:MAG: hypothetical protein ACLQVD_05645 [Capsulimonadaceae bacterium]
MIRKLISGLLIVALGYGCGYNWWQAVQLRAQVDQLKTTVATLRRAEAKHSSHRSGHFAKLATHPSQPPQSPEDLLAAANMHADKARAAFDAHNYGTATQEAAAAMDDIHRASQGPAQELAEARQKMDKLTADMGGALQRVKTVVGQ